MMALMEASDARSHLTKVMSTLGYLALTASMSLVALLAFRLLK